MKTEFRKYIQRSLAPDLAARARIRREALGKSVSEMAALVDVTPQTIARWESGDLPASMTPTRIEAWEAALQVPVGWLLSPDGKLVSDIVIAQPEPISIAASVQSDRVLIPTVAGHALGLRAYARRRKLGLTRAQVSEWAGISIQTLLKWEKGELPRTIHIDRLYAWETALALPAGWLLAPDGEEPMTPPSKRQRVTINADTISDAIRKVAICLATRGRNLAFPDRRIDAGAQRDADLFACRYGVGGAEGNTLNELAAPLGITRERVRQIIEKLIERSSQFEFDIPVLDALALQCAPHLPCPVSVLNSQLRAQLGEYLTLEGASTFANDLLGKRIVRISEPISQPGGSRIDLWAYGPGEDDVALADDIKAVRSIAYAMIRSCGVALLPTVAGTVSLAHGRNYTSLVNMLQSVDGFEWLDADRSWFWFGSEKPSHNVILSVARKIFAVARGRVDIDDLLAAIMRFRSRTATVEFDRDRTLMLIPPIHIARAVLERVSWLHVVQHDDYRANTTLNPAMELSETELRLVAALEARDGVASRFELRSALHDIKLITFSAALMTTPVVRLVSHGVYAIIGRPVDPTAFARATSPREGAPNRIEVRRHSDGSVSFAYVITEFAVESKVCLIPASAVPHVPEGEYSVRDSASTVDCVNRSSGATVLNRLVQAMLAQGYDSGDVVRIMIHPGSRIIELSPDDGTTAA
ncbi:MULTISPECIES: helix-turn-helix transcriptional regulator [unclassified Burkholderia]|uniref:helix-turn-helix transcriptional regulator n=1 Tax=unclassified Burkholderia TaxID=2613784 RepID=UPI002AB2283C|nr:MULTISPECIES: helix-turn-helix domain-containing protein [unclassified Burkholderia]